MALKWLNAIKYNVSLRQGMKQIIDGSIKSVNNTVSHVNFCFFFFYICFLFVTLNEILDFRWACGHSGISYSSIFSPMESAAVMCAWLQNAFHLFLKTLHGSLFLSFWQEGTASSCTTGLSLKQQSSKWGYSHWVIRLCHKQTVFLHI